MPPYFDYLFHSGNLIIFAVIAWQIIRAINRVMAILKDFPPHRHVNGSVIYPEGYEPTEIQRLGNFGKSN